MLSGKKLLLLGFIVVLLVVIPLTVYLVSQQQKLGAGATPQTNISFSQLSVSTFVNQTFTEDINITTGGNQVSFVKLTINFDPTKLTPTALGTTLCPAHPDYVICPSSLFPNPPLQGPTVNGGSVSITMSVGSNPSNVITTTTPTKIATVNFKALSATTTPTQISFASADQTQVLSIASGDQFNENVLQGQPTPANVTITSSGATPTPTPIPTPTPTPTPVSATPRPTTTPVGAGSSGGASTTTQIITVAPTSTATATPIATVPTPIATPQPTLAPTGPGDRVVSLGALGIISSIIGAIILFAL